MKTATKSIIRLYLPLITIAIVIAFLFFNSGALTSIISVFRPVILAFAIAYILDSVANVFIKRLKMKRTVGILLTYLIFVGAVAAAISFVVPVISENFNSLVDFFVNGDIDVNRYIEDLSSRTNNAIVTWVLDNFTDSTGETSQQVIEYITAALQYISNFVVSLVSNIGGGILAFLSSFVMSIYMLLEKEDLLNRVKRTNHAYFSENRAKKLEEVLEKANHIFKMYFNGKILDSTIVGMINIFLFTIFGVPYGLIMGILVGAANMIPYFGPFFGSVPVIVVSLFVNPPKALVALIIIIAVGQVDANFIDPRIIGKAVGVSPFWVISGVSMGAIAAGPLGMILGVPTVVLVKTLIEEDVELRLAQRESSSSSKDNPL
ncbi:Predicted PurR-regulated permease PerM [Dethiosulfatibacter aminovorans DSM 17477]|uniref:Predicted PurR-regulated permease PerM n=1 Tax=Dethiosulfatibacter aminovorans DSM 17477 TaxID=1121476 RepID=A0A1M6C7L4_9FIRM|nr:AI-2E family transporter [Dethiosulfatibacter aminovorans]SHI56996.1 Predicted PurR-regulated permease PerM [Dethiosulfatibacter aminovorans DSM 17477]